MSETSQELQFQATQETPSTPEFVSPEAMQYVDSWGLFGIMVIIALEMATPIGILFPTDAIVFGGGMYFSSKGGIPGGIWTIIILFSIAVIAGDLLGFWWGKMLAPKIATMQDSRYFKRKWIVMCEKYFDEYGSNTMLISKFLPIRSMIPIVAGVIQKPTGPYVIQSVISAVLWIGSLLGISYFIIWLIPSAANHIGLLTFLFVVLPQVGSIWYALLPMYRKYEKKLATANENIQNISQEFRNIGTQFGNIGKEFIAIGGEIKNIITKVVVDEEKNTDHGPIVGVQAPAGMMSDSSLVSSSSYQEQGTVASSQKEMDAYMVGNTASTSTVEASSSSQDQQYTANVGTYEQALSNTIESKPIS